MTNLTHDQMREAWVATRNKRPPINLKYYNVVKLWYLSAMRGYEVFSYPFKRSVVYFFEEMDDRYLEDEE